MFDQKEYMKKYWGKNKEYLSERKKEYYQNNKEKILINAKEYHQKNKEHKSEYDKEYHRKNREKLNKNSRMWLKTEKGKANNQRGKSKRRARERDIINTLTAEEWLTILKQHNFKCVYCGKDLFDLFTIPERDHIIPISKGGDNTKENILPACRSCNAKKNAKILRR